MSSHEVRSEQRAAASEKLSLSPLTETEIALMRQSFAKVDLISDTAAALFYARLFELNPTLRALFASDLKDQGRKLMTVLRIAAAGLDQVPMLLPIIEGLGRRHASYGVRDRDYETLGAALIWTVERCLGATFTPEVEAAWIKVYGSLAEIMKTASKQEAA